MSTQQSLEIGKIREILIEIGEIGKISIEIGNILARYLNKINKIEFQFTFITIFPSSLALSATSLASGP